MTFREFLSDRTGRIILELCILAMSVCLLSVTGTQPDILLLLFVFLAFIRITVLLIDFFTLRSHLAQLEHIMANLPQKYLFTECAPPPKTIYERRLFALMRRSCKSMTEAVSDAEAARREYRETVESWVHEIKSPITAAKLICHGIEPEPRRRLAQELFQIEAHVERALFYARTENPEKDFIIQQYNLDDIVAEAIETYGTLLMQSNIRVETGNLHYQIYTDRKWTCFILGQLLQNAARYKNEQSAFAHDSLIHDTSVIIVSAEPSDKDRLKLTVSDNGIGIPAHELPRVFDRGFTGSNGRARGGSTGMGLYLCHKLSDFLGLAIQITSVEGEGTSVTLSFLTKM